LPALTSVALAASRLSRALYTMIMAVEDIVADDEVTACSQAEPNKGPQPNCKNKTQPQKF
jgi:hypothetical protein